VNIRHSVVVGLSVVGLVLAAGAPARAQAGEEARIRDATTVLGEIMSTPDRGIPKAILGKAEAIAIFPGLIRAGLAVGGQFGHGVICVRNREAGTWSAPAFLTIAGGSFGAQIGAQSIDLVLVIMDATGVQRLLGNQFKIGAEASVAAGPVGRSAEAATDIQLRAKILSYSRSRGLFGGIALNGSTMAADEDANQRFYGQRMGSRDVVAKASSREDLPEVVGALRKALAEHADRRP
jgi:lipid-binding SYLF domain-containing protein